MGNGIFHFGCSAFDGITGRTILAEVYPKFTETEAEDFLRLLSKLIDVEYLVEKRHTLPWMVQGVVNRLVSKIEGLFQYLDHDIPKTSNQAEQKFSFLFFGAKKGQEYHVYHGD